MLAAATTTRGGKLMQASADDAKKCARRSLVVSRRRTRTSVSPVCLAIVDDDGAGITYRGYHLRGSCSDSLMPAGLSGFRHVLLLLTREEGAIAICGRRTQGLLWNGSGTSGRSRAEAATTTASVSAAECDVRRSAVAVRQAQRPDHLAPQPRLLSLTEPRSGRR